MKKIINKIWDFFGRLFGSVKKFEKWLELHVPEAIQIIGKILGTLTNPITGSVLDYVLTLLPENLENASMEVKRQAIKYLADAARIMNIGNDCLNIADDVEVIICFVNALKQRSPIDAQGTATKLGSIYLMQKNPDLKLSDTDTALQLTFKAQKIDSIAA